MLFPVGVSPAPTLTTRRAYPPLHPTAAHQGPRDRLAFAARIGENAIATKRPKLIMPTPEKIPKIMAEKFAAITKLTDGFCATHLNEEYRRVIQRVVGALARKRPSPLVKGKEAVWAGAAVHAVGRVNFLDDPSQSPHCKPKVIYEFFGIVDVRGLPIEMQRMAFEKGLIPYVPAAQSDRK